MSQIKTLIVGAYGLFSEAFLVKAHKEAYETFIITGSKKKEGIMHSGVADEYHFQYDNSNIQYILESTKVDTVIFTGALDPIFKWNNKKDAVTYLSGLMNILVSSSKLSVKKFIYLSTTDVYQTEDMKVIDENAPSIPTQFKALTIRNGEELALNFNNKEETMQVIVLRCSEVYGVCNGKVNMDSFCTELAMQLLGKAIPDLDSKRRHDYIHIFDVIDVVFKIIAKDQIPHKIYNICSNKSKTEIETFQAISLLLGNETEAKFEDKIKEQDVNYSNYLAVVELGLYTMHSFEKGFPTFLITIQKLNLHSNTISKESNSFVMFRNQLQTVLGWFYPYLETILLFVVAQVLVILTKDVIYFTMIDFYLLYIVLTAIKHGKGQTITALLLSLIGKITLMHKEMTFSSIVVDYNTYMWLLQLLIIGMGVGYIRDRNKQVIEDREEDITYLQGELTDIKEINHSNIRIKKTYENRLINYKDSFGRIYSIISNLMDLEPDKIVFAAVDVISQIMDSKDILIYTVNSNSMYARLAASSANSSYTAQKSVKLDSLLEVYGEIVKRKIFVNRTMNSEKPAMAGGIYHDDTLESIVMIWSLPFENTTLYHVNLFTVVLNLIAQALHRSSEHLEESRMSRFLEGTRIMTQKAFQRIIDIQKKGSDTNLTEYFMAKVVKGESSLKEINDMIMPTLRQNDYLGIDENDELYLLLTNTNDKEAEFVINRLLQKGITIRKDVEAFNGA